MEIAILGGTGDLGRGLALRWGRDADHDLVIGSRERERAVAAADEYREHLAARAVDATLSGAVNEEAAVGADLVVVAVPPSHVPDVVASIGASPAEDAILVSPAASLRGDDAGVHANPPDAGSVTALAAEAAPPETPVVGAFHTLSAGLLADLDREFEMDTLVVGDDPEARRTVATVAEDVDGLRALDAGPLANAPEIESMTALLITLARYDDGLEDVGVRFR